MTRRTTLAGSLLEWAELTKHIRATLAAAGLEWREATVHARTTAGVVMLEWAPPPPRSRTSLIAIVMECDENVDMMGTLPGTSPPVWPDPPQSVKDLLLAATLGKQGS